ncbi:MAG: hypothetical protein A2722_02515 [Candidatus Doudnabacteria bacterium RIFCSPHIGHO2_01_FULL_50_11]|uniref:Secondary thiamine-phosphate synthase enzyme n=1 Tax=Candidatus Doudnabacteria bacterium RIFCSPHIGHO2_01_FULL_50_11 TaxID=1817828 RepID=A0A1F5PGE3_9BACT|nr:MAG: hypothetical protein A2722_02515 [Candidatus Doudnabacteria bacterium RIFCSPHIGHO2_01_FULL_50_11]HLC45009.1 secondary thiamine-phosphate synthase enzyme YjbQ [Patescibacteria group bacterium]
MTHTKTISLTSHRQFEIINITKHVETVVTESKIRDGVAIVFAPHTTAAIRLNHHEPLLIQDFMKLMYRLAPIENNYAHDFFEVRTNPAAAERSNGHAHLKALLLGASASIPIKSHSLFLGPRQSVFFVELDGGRKRSCVITIIGE